jgi:hypothetical protein
MKIPLTSRLISSNLHSLYPSRDMNSQGQELKMLINQSKGNTLSRTCQLLHPSPKFHILPRKSSFLRKIQILKSRPQKRKGNKMVEIRVTLPNSLAEALFTCTSLFSELPQYLLSKIEINLSCKNQQARVRRREVHQRGLKQPTLCTEILTWRIKLLLFRESTINC